MDRKFCVLCMCFVFGVSSCTATKTRKTISFAEAIGIGGRGQATALAERANAISKCMNDQGFRYVPSLPAPSRVPDNSGEPKTQRTNGYGVWQSIEDSRVALKKESSGPNAEYRRTLSPQDQAAFDEAINGSENSLGCKFKVGPTDGIRQTMMQKYIEVIPRIQADPRMQELDRQWSSCMKQKGYSVGTFLDIFSGVIGPLQAAIPQDLNSLDSDFDAALQKLKAEEIRVANADVDCTSDTDRASRKAIKSEYEGELINNNSDLLDQLQKTTYLPSIRLGTDQSSRFRACEIAASRSSSV
jgi:hypothetical protein